MLKGFLKKKYVDLHGLIDECLVPITSNHGNSIQIIRNYSKTLPKIMDWALTIQEYNQ